jgi:chemotaxis-related protein WspD
MLEPLATKPAGTPAAIDDCWNRIGVRGDNSCPELDTHVHCRNCPVYWGAARTLFDRALPAGYLADWTEHFAKPEGADGAATHSAVIFRLGAEWFALPTTVIDEIAELRRIHALPHQRNAAVLGLVNIRGELVICVSLARMLAIGEGGTVKADRDSIARARLAVVRHASGRIAFPVDEAQRMHRLADGEVRPVPATVAKGASNYTVGLLSWRDHMVGYLDHERILQAVGRTIA